MQPFFLSYREKSGQHAACKAIVQPCSKEKPEEQSHQHESDEINPPCHRNQQNAEKRAVKCSLPDLRERKGD
jgi:hypothetical protein